MPSSSHASGRLYAVSTSALYILLRRISVESHSVRANIGSFKEWGNEYSDHQYECDHYCYA